MAIFERQAAQKVILDETEPIKCTIENWQNVNGHTEFTIKVERTPFSDQTWKINRRYNDFCKLHNMLQVSGIPLDLPPKKLFGNMDPQFISERQQGLQKYLDNIFMNPILVSSLPARSFVDPANYSQPFGELALQHVSLALRSEVGWEVISPVADIGWRLRKHYYQLKNRSIPKEEYIASWTDYGPDKYLEVKDMHNIIKSLKQLQHPFIHSIELCLSTDIGALVVRTLNKNGTLRDLLCGAKPRQSFLKKYGNPKGHKALTIDNVSHYGRQILEALKFIHDKGLPYGHLHSGNILIENNRIKLLDVENGILGVPSFYRPYFMQHRKINNLEAIDVYCFGHVLYEMMFGTPLHESIIDSVPDCPIIELNLLASDKAHFKIPSSIKEQLKSAIAKTEGRLKEEQKLVRNQKKLVKIQEMMSSEEEKKKQRQRLKQARQLDKEQQKQVKSNNEKLGTNEERSDSVISSTGTSVGTATPPSVSGSNNVPSPPPPPPPPPLGLVPQLPPIA
ncbi:hypothetical protein NQ317_000203 [Molorchus minor]|uniref:PX domain-containing protein kinase-like protein n=1 Tax=Molorchus minor TaxID=1323400 RepID=A0ABQ9JAK3_9CUCU|nr:hypothetical protein NQ317_000203 [Molorchus minor]